MDFQERERLLRRLEMCAKVRFDLAICWNIGHHISPKHDSCCNKDPNLRCSGSQNKLHYFRPVHLRPEKNQQRSWASGWLKEMRWSTIWSKTGPYFWASGQEWAGLPFWVLMATFRSFEVTPVVSKAQKLWTSGASIWIVCWPRNENETIDGPGRKYAMVEVADAGPPFRRLQKSPFAIDLVAEDQRILEDGIAWLKSGRILSYKSGTGRKWSFEDLRSIAQGAND